jgi:hypothetical protein
MVQQFKKEIKGYNQSKGNFCKKNQARELAEKGTPFSSGFL